MDKILVCFTTDEEGNLIRVENGVLYKTCVQFKTRELNQRKADKLNADMGVTKRQVAAMLHLALNGSNTIPIPTYTTSGKVFHPISIK